MLKDKHKNVFYVLRKKGRNPLTSRAIKWKNQLELVGKRK